MKRNPPDLTLRNRTAITKQIKKLKEAEVKNYNRLWLLINDQKKVIKKLKLDIRELKKQVRLLEKKK